MITFRADMKVSCVVGRVRGVLDERGAGEAAVCAPFVGAGAREQKRRQRLPSRQPFLVDFAPYKRKSAR